MNVWKICSESKMMMKSFRWRESAKIEEGEEKKMVQSSENEEGVGKGKDEYK